MNEIEVYIEYYNINSNKYDGFIIYFHKHVTHKCLVTHCNYKRNKINRLLFLSLLEYKNYEDHTTVCMYNIKDVDKYIEILKMVYGQDYIITYNNKDEVSEFYKI